MSTDSDRAHLLASACTHPRPNVAETGAALAYSHLPAGTRTQQQPPFTFTVDLEKDK